MAWTYRVGLSKDEVSKEVLDKSGLKYEEVEVESALREHIPETLNKPYKFYTSMREDAPNCFSCSSLVSYLYLFAGVWMPSLAKEKFAYAKPISREELRFGDLVFSHTDPERESPSHVGMYLGDGKILQAAGISYKGMVLIEDLDTSPSFQKIVGFGRLVDDLKERRYVVTIPDDMPGIRNKEALLEYLKQYA